MWARAALPMLPKTCIRLTHGSRRCLRATPPAQNNERTELRSCITVLGKRDGMNTMVMWLDGGKMRDDKFDLPTSSWWILGFTALATLLAVVMGMAQVLAT